MRTKIIMLLVVCSLFTGKVNAQWVVSDPGNLAQGIINASKNIVQTSSTAQNMIKNFQETVKIYQQGKEYYDRLKSVHNLVKDARKVQKSILLIGEISDIYVNSFQKMLSDENYTPDQGRRIKNYFPVKVVTNIFHPIPLLVFSDSCFLLLFSHSLVW